MGNNRFNFDITQINPKIDSETGLLKLLKDGYNQSFKFFNQDVTGIEVKIFYTRTEFNDYCDEGKDANYEGFTRKGVLALASPNWFFETKIKDGYGGIITTQPFSREIKKEGFYPRLVNHEVAHMFIQKLFPHFKVPIWMDEGIPTYISGVPTVDKSQVLEPNRIYSMHELHSLVEWLKLPTDKTNYEQGASMIRYMLGDNEKGKPQLFALMSDLTVVDSLDDFSTKLKHQFGFDAKQLHEGWLDYLKSK